MSSTSFILAPPTVSLDSAPTLHLLPFSLANGTYSTSSSSIPKYFHPRAPPHAMGLPDGTQIAAFRGRTIVGQSVSLPSHYRGFVLSAPAVHSLQHRAAEEIPTSTAPAGSASGSTSTRTRPRGTGQVALAKPRTRQVARRNTRKRIKLDSDEEGDTEGSNEKVKGDIQPEEMEVDGVKNGEERHFTPRKRIPSITVSVPTPPKPSLRRETTETSLVDTEIDNGSGSFATDVAEFTSGQVESQGSCSSSVRGLRRESGSAMTITSEPETGIDTREASARDLAGLGEPIVPSPATEDVLPTFALTPDAETSSDSPDAIDAKPTVHGIDTAAGSSVRLLRPTATFCSIMLWTPDGPLAGYHPASQTAPVLQVESNGSHLAAAPNGASHAIDSTGITSSRVEIVPLKTDDAQGDGAWWNPRGGGEGGDEFVRALGEFIGLAELVNEPVYLLDGSADYDDEEEEEVE